MSDLTNKDAEQDTKIAVIDSTLDNSIRRIEMVHKRVDGTNEELEKLQDHLFHSWRFLFEILLQDNALEIIPLQRKLFFGNLNQWGEDDFSRLGR